ncbi:hypothetical protein LRHK_2189 [Lacticaseibacillus rhamnosus ATCC 8530]|nr:hypothetical protein LRHK_2189 [Lacticaseibacillus rhamnosus ATCC 8530]
MESSGVFGCMKVVATELDVGCVIWVMQNRHSHLLFVSGAKF